MTTLPPVPAANQSPFPIEEPPHADAGTAAPSAVPSSIEDGIASVKAAVTPLTDKATAFAKARPWATAALVGTVALAVINTLRGKRP